jgi:hypothetical protein
LIGIVFVTGIGSILFAESSKTPAGTDPIERVLLPTITGLIGVLGGLYASTNSRQ